jgi:hypothetical protein
MIKASELRIGNLLYSESGRNATVYRVMGIDIESDRAKMKCNPAVSNIQLKYMVPIPLTPEWLERCGFVDDIPWRKGNLRLDSENRLIIVDSTGYGIIVARNVLYLHQLQNLYFSLTGEDLEINMP